MYIRPDYHYTTTSHYTHCILEEKPVLRLQKKKLEPLRKWAESHFGVVLNTTDTMEPIKHASHEVAPLLQHIDGLDDFRMAVFDSLGTLCSSSIIPLALMEGRIDAQEVSVCVCV
jgi:chaperone required for assembly of F1-ATPase